MTQVLPRVLRWLYFQALVATLTMHGKIVRTVQWPLLNAMNYRVLLGRIHRYECHHFFEQEYRANERARVSLSFSSDLTCFIWNCLLLQVQAVETFSHGIEYRNRELFRSAPRRNFLKNSTVLSYSTPSLERSVTRLDLGPTQVKHQQVFNKIYSSWRVVTTYRESETHADVIWVST